MSLLLLFPSSEIVVPIPTVIDFNLNFEITFTVGDPIPTAPGEEATWQYLRRQVTAYVLPREVTLNHLRREMTIYKWKF